MTSIKIKIQGHSGCQIKVFEDDGNYFVAKKTQDINYIPRLKKQHNKHKEFKSSFDTIQTPEISGYIETPKAYSYFMKYIQGEDAIAFLERATIKDIESFSQNLITFLTESFNKAKNTLFPTMECRKKLDAIGQELHANNPFCKPLAHLYKLLDRLTSTQLPIGLCHGDLTLSNMIINQKTEITVFDFLDSFVESPIIDIAKLFQDTRHHWILHKHQSQDPIHIQSCFSLINEQLTLFIEENSINKSQLAFFEYLSLLRIVSYTREQHTLDFLAKQLDRAIQQ